MGRRKNSGWLPSIGNVSVISVIINPISMMIAVAVLAMVLWNRYHERLDLAVNRNIDEDLIRVSERPEWVKADVKNNAFQESRLGELRLSQPDTVERVAASFAVQPWVKQVVRVVKTPRGIDVDLRYRRPLAIVEIGRRHLVPVDDEAVVLDGSGLAPEDLSQYWRISVPQVVTQGLATGRAWNDLRVQDSVAIAAAWQDRWTSTGLMRIVNRSRPTSDRQQLRPYELWTRRGTIVVWGNPPGQETAGEATAEEKINAILQFVNDNGPLDALTHRQLDVRQGIVVPATSKLARENADFIHSKF